MNTGEKITKLICLNKILRSGIIVSDAFFDELGKCVILNKKGEQLREELQKLTASLTPEYINTCIFYKLCTNDFLVDSKMTDCTEIESILCREIINRNIRYVWIHDNILYHKYFNTVAEPSHQMSFDEVISFLDSTPQGTYQFYDLIVGEFGIFHSKYYRNNIPSRKYFLWHCSNPACNTFHDVQFSFGGNIGLKKVLNHLEKYDSKENIEIIAKFYYDKINTSTYKYDYFYTGQLPIFLGSCFDEMEIRLLLESLIDSNQKFYRQIFGSKKLFIGSSSEITSRLTKSQCLPLILLIDDATILNNLEKLIDNNSIIIPPTEKRRAKLFDNGSSNFLSDLVFECSKFGIRLVDKGAQIGLRRLELLIKKLYNTPEEIDDLNWKLRLIKDLSNGQPIKYEKLSIYLLNEDVRNIILNLVFCNIDKIRKTAEFLRFGNFDYTQTSEGEEYLLNKIIWKLGFNIYYYPDEIKIFWERYNKFYTECLKYDDYDEDAKEAIRSKSVNFFVSFEAFLKRSLTFQCWLLLSDHYKDTKLKFCYDENKNKIYEFLHNFHLSHDTTLSIDPNGKDTIYPLIEGFYALSKLCEILKIDKDKYINSSSSFPSGYNEEVFFFPFLHKYLILDLDEKVADAVINELHNISHELKTIDVCNIRNSTSHQRENNEFPNKEKIVSFCENLKRIIIRMESIGIYPLVYTCSKTISDSYDRMYAELKNYKGDIVKINKLNNYLFDVPPLNHVQIIVPLIKLRSFDTALCIFIQDTSNYTKMWSDYPKRRVRKGKSGEIQTN